MNDINSGNTGIISRRDKDTAVPCPYSIIFGRDTALPIGVNLSLKALVSLAFSRVYNPLNPPW
jgi:hypothetical protein